MGGLEEVLKMLPAGKQLKGMKINEKDLLHQRAIIQSMTKKERINPALLNASRRRRIAQGSGTQVSDVNRLINGYEQSKTHEAIFRQSRQKRKDEFSFYVINHSLS